MFMAIRFRIMDFHITRFVRSDFNCSSVTFNAWVCYPSLCICDPMLSLSACWHGRPLCLSAFLFRLPFGATAWFMQGCHESLFIQALLLLHVWERQSSVSLADIWLKTASSASYILQIKAEFAKVCLGLSNHLIYSFYNARKLRNHF